MYHYFLCLLLFCGLKWSRDASVEWKINQLLVKCKECKVKCTVKKYRKFDCSTAHEGINMWKFLLPNGYICVTCI